MSARRASVARTAAALGFALLAAAPAHAGCRAETRVSPTRAFVGQRLFWTVEILRSEGVEKMEWLESPSFPGFRATWLPGRVDPEPLTRDGVRWRRSEERRALFPARAGRLRIPGARLGCGASSAAVAGVSVEVDALPEGAPPGFAGVVGPVRVLTRLEPGRIRLGEAARLWVVLRGPGNLWTVPSPLAEDALEDADVFAERPATEVDADADVVVRRTFRYQLVPRREGALVLPAVHVPWFDPEARAYRTASGPARTLHVGEAATLPFRERAPQE